MAADSLARRLKLMVILPGLAGERAKWNEGRYEQAGHPTSDCETLGWPGELTGRLMTALSRPDTHD